MVIGPARLDECLEPLMGCPYILPPVQMFYMDPEKRDPWFRPLRSNPVVWGFHAGEYHHVNRYVVRSFEHLVT